MINLIVFFPKKKTNFQLKFRLEMLKLVLTPLLELFWQLARKFSVFIRKRKNIKFQDKYFSSKCFFRDVESSIDNPAKKIARRLMNFANCPRRKKRNILYWKKVKFSSKTSYKHADCRSDCHVQKFFNKETKKVCSKSEGNKLKKSFHKQLSPQNFSRDT